MAIAIINDLNNIFAYMPIDEVKGEHSVKTAVKKKDFITEIKETTGNILKLADYLESNWDKLNAEQKEKLKSFTYSYIGEERIQITGGISIFTTMKTAYSILKSLKSGKLSMSDVGDFFIAFDRLNNAVLCAVEEESPAYKKDLQELIEAELDINTSTLKYENKNMSYGEFNEWLNGVATKTGK